MRQRAICPAIAFVMASGSTCSLRKRGGLRFTRCEAVAAVDWRLDVERPSRRDRALTGQGPRSSRPGPRSGWTASSSRGERARRGVLDAAIVTTAHRSPITARRPPVTVRRAAEPP